MKQRNVKTHADARAHTHTHTHTHTTHEETHISKYEEKKGATHIPRPSLMVSLGSTTRKGMPASTGLRSVEKVGKGERGRGSGSGKRRKRRRRRKWEKEKECKVGGGGGGR